MERTLTLDDLREFEQYPGLAVDRKAHFSRFANKTIVHRDYHRNYTLMTYILLFFIFAFIGWIWDCSTPGNDSDDHRIPACSEADYEWYG